MPFQILSLWLRGLLAVALLLTGLSLLGLWWQHRYVFVAEPPGEVTRAEPDDPERPTANGETRRPPGTAEHVRRVDWQFGWNRETLYLLGGLALTGWSLGGGWSTRLLRCRGNNRPTQAGDGEARRVRRPDGTELHVEFYGPPDGPVLVLTHGWGCDSSEWDYVKRELGDRFRLIVWDLPGLGRSTPPADNDYTLEKLAGDLQAVVHLAGERPAVLVGHSIGGMIMLTYCRLFPAALGQRVRGLVLAHTTYTNPVKTTSRAALYTALQKPVLEPLCHLMTWLAPLVWVLNWLSYLNGSAHRSTERSAFSGRETREQLDFYAAFTPKCWPAVIGRGMLGMFHYDATATLPTIPVPALVVAGDQDRTCTPEASVFLSQAIPRARLLTLQPAKHAGLFEHHGPFAEALREFAAACHQEADRPKAARQRV
jgi:pimeloyl-ACP methyl ester carboxylesterase